MGAFSPRLMTDFVNRNDSNGGRKWHFVRGWSNIADTISVLRSHAAALIHF